MQRPSEHREEINSEWWRTGVIINGHNIPYEDEYKDIQGNRILAQRTSQESIPHGGTINLVKHEYLDNPDHKTGDDAISVVTQLNRTAVTLCDGTTNDTLGDILARTVARSGSEALLTWPPSRWVEMIQRLQAHVRPHIEGIKKMRYANAIELKTILDSNENTSLYLDRNSRLALNPEPNRKSFAHKIAMTQLEKILASSGESTYIGAVIEKNKLYILSIGDSPAVILHPNGSSTIIQSKAKGAHISGAGLVGKDADKLVIEEHLLSAGDIVLLASDGILLHPDAINKIHSILLGEQDDKIALEKIRQFLTLIVQADDTTVFFQRISKTPEIARGEIATTLRNLDGSAWKKGSRFVKQ